MSCCAQEFGVFRWLQIAYWGVSLRVKAIFSACPFQFSQWPIGAFPPLSPLMKCTIHGSDRHFRIAFFHIVRHLAFPRCSMQKVFVIL